MFSDRHHLLYDRVSWSARPEAKALRENKSLIIRLDREEHNELHRHSVAIPVLGYHALCRTLRFYEPQSTPLQSVEMLMSSIERAVDHPKSHPIERQLGQLAVWGLDLQRPFIAGKQYES